MIKNKKILSLTLSSLMALSILSGCTQKEGAISTSQTQEEETNEYKNYVYRGENILSNLNFDASFKRFEDGFYNLEVSYPQVADDEAITFEENLTDEDAYSMPMEEFPVDYKITFYDENFKETDVKSFSGKSSYGDLLFVDKNKNMYFFEGAYTDEDKLPNLLKLSSDGTEIYKQELDLSSEYGAYIRTILSDGTISYLVDGNSNLYTLDLETGKILENLYTTTDYNFIEFFLIDGKIYCVQNQFENGTKIGILNKDTKQIEDIEIKDIPLDIYEFQSGINSNLFAKQGDSFYEIDLKTNTCKKIIDFIQSDINVSDINQIFEMEDGFGICLNNEDSVSLYKFTKVDPKDVKEKTIIRIGCYYLPYEIRKNIIEFNKENPDIRISVEDYGNSEIMFKANTESFSGIEALDKEIISGNIPDILILKDYDKLNNYAKKNLFVDYNKVLTAENGFDIENITDNVRNLFETDGKLYILPTSYTVKAFVAKKSLLDKLNPYTIETVNKYIKDNNITESDFLGFMLRDYALTSILQSSGNSFINIKEGTCSFDTKEFKDMLLFIKNLPLSEEVYTENYEYEDESAFYRQDRYILSQLFLSTTSDYVRAKYGEFGEDIEISGMPSSNKTISLVPEYLVAVTDNENTQKSLEFIKFIFGEEMQSSSDVYSFPVNKTALDKKFEKEAKGLFYEENGKEIYYEEPYYIGDVEIKLPKPTQDDINKVKEIIESVNYVEIEDSELYDIILEEVQPFYEGQKDIDEVVKILQSRVGIYLAEHK